MEEKVEHLIDGCPRPDDSSCMDCPLHLEIQERWAYKQNEIIISYPREEWDYHFKIGYKTVVETAFMLHPHYRGCPRYSTLL